MAQPGFRTKSIVVVTTLMDPQVTTKEDLAMLYRAVEQRARSAIDQVDHADAPPAVQDVRLGTQRDLGAHPGVQSHPHDQGSSAATHDLLPRSIRFKSTCQTLEALQLMIELRAVHSAAQRLRLYQHLLGPTATHRVADRPDRFEPRVKKEPRNHYGWLTRPRADFKRDMAN